MQKHLKIKTQLLGIEMYYLLYRTHWPLTPPEHSPCESIPLASRERAGWTFEHHSELQRTAPETSDSKTDFHITWDTRRDTQTQSTKVDEKGWSLSWSLGSQVSSPVIFGVAEDSFCKHVHRLGVLGLLEHLNALHWRRSHTLLCLE